MSLNSARAHLKSFFTSLKFRLILNYALLFFVFSSLLFGVVIWQLQGILLRSGDEAGSLVIGRISSLLISGDRPNNFQDFTDTSELPDFDRNMIETAMPDALILYVAKQPRIGKENSGNFYYTSFLYHNSDYYECRVRDDGSIFSKKILIRRNIPAIKRYFSRVLNSFGNSNILCAVIGTDGKFDAVSSNSVSHPNFDFPATIPNGSSPMQQRYFRYLADELPCGRKVVVAWNIQKYNDVINQLIVIFYSVMLVILILGIFTAYWLSRRFIQGIKKTTMAMLRISGGDYSYRIEDITDSDREIRELMETFNAMNERTEILLKDIKMMSDNVAHDLRTPLTRISGTVELLLCNRDLDEQVRSVCVSVAEETARLRDMVNTIMDISHTTYRPGELNREPIELTGMISDMCDFIQPEFEEKELELILDLPEEELFISADKVKLQRLVINLLENALKFTSAGSVTARVARGDDDTVVLQISDTGCGISEDDLKHIFERFYRADNSRHLQGNGLGLALVEAIAKAHNWTLDVTSAPGKGTTFTLRISRSKDHSSS